MNPEHTISMSFTSKSPQARDEWMDAVGQITRAMEGRPPRLRTPPFRAMMDPEDRELIRGMTVPEMEYWQLKLVRRDPVEATKERPYDFYEEQRKAEARQLAFERLVGLDSTMTPEGHEAFKKDAEAGGYTPWPHGMGDSLSHYKPFEPIEPVSLDNVPQDPHGTPQHAPGAKLDAGKQAASLLLDFSRALSAVAEVSSYGAVKYSRGGWQHVPDGITRYRDAEWRHLLKEREEECDPESGLPHSFHRAWNVLAVLELELRAEEQKQAIQKALDP